MSTIDFILKTKALEPSLASLDIKDMEGARIESIEDLGWYDNERLANWTINNTATKKK